MVLETLQHCPVCHSTKFKPHLTCTDHTATLEQFQLQRCENCQLVLTNPQPKASELYRYYQSAKYISHTGKSAGPIDYIYLLVRRLTSRWKVRIIKKYKQPQTILDYGCGTGELLRHYQQQGWDIQGLEPTEAARRKAEEITGINIASKLEDLEGHKFDVITLWHVLEHISTLTETLQQLEKLLNDNGVLLIAVPNYLSNDATQYGPSWAAYDVPRHLWHFSQPTMAILLSKLSLSLTATRPMPLDAYYVCLLSQQYQTPNNSYISNFTRGIIQAIKSNSKAKTTSNYSSLIYIAKK